jgi:hypothetical protein
MRFTAIRSLGLCALITCSVAAIPAAMLSQTSPKEGAGVRFTATTENVSGAGEPIKINLTSWSSDTQRDELVIAWNLTASAPAAAAAGRGGRGARGAAAGRGARGGRGGGAAAAPAADVPADPDAPDDPDSPAFRFGRGGARGGAANDSQPQTPQASLAAALKKAPTVGILWTSETVGYSIKYAYRLQQPDGGERIVLATDRRVGAWSNLWKPAGTIAPTDYAFSIIELRLNPKGEGEGKGAVAGKVAVESQSKTIGLDGYSTLPVVLKGVKREPQRNGN